MQPLSREARKKLRDRETKCRSQQAKPYSAITHCSDQWTTPDELVRLLRSWSPGSLQDLCPYQPSWAPGFYWDALEHPWPREPTSIGFLNPPFGKAASFLTRLRDQWQRGCSALMLLPAETVGSMQNQGLVPS